MLEVQALPFGVLAVGSEEKADTAMQRETFLKAWYGRCTNRGAMVGSLRNADS